MNRVSIIPRKRASAKSSTMVASGAITLSAEEWLMSRSCHRATFSKAVSAYPRRRRASPHRVSDRTGLRLGGLAEEPFCPYAQRSSHRSPLEPRRHRPGLRAVGPPDHRRVLVIEGTLLQDLEDLSGIPDEEGEGL